MAVFLSPLFNDAPYVSTDSNPAVGYLLYTYTAGSSTPQPTYTSSTGLVQNANPMTLNSGGYPTTSGTQTQVWLSEGVAYKFILETPGGSVVWTRDRISGINDTSGSQDQWVSGPVPTFVSTTSFSLVGDQTNIFHIGRRIKTTNSGGTIYSTITNSAFGAVTTVTVANDSGVLDSGLSAVSYGIISAADSSEPHIGDTYVCDGRLTLTTATPVTTADVTAATTVYFSPYQGNKVDLYDASALRWVRYKFTERTISVPATTITMYDVFLYSNAGTLTLEAVAWTNDTARATALVTQDGVLVKSGAAGRRYIGSFRTTGVSGQTEDSRAKRFVWNYYNRVMRAMRVVEAANTWNYTLAAYQQANASTANQLDFIVGVLEDMVRADVFHRASNGGASNSVDFSVGIGLDSVTVNSATVFDDVPLYVTSLQQTLKAQYVGYPGLGRHILVWLEYSGAAGTTTWYGDDGSTLTQSGITGELRG